MYWIQLRCACLRMLTFTEWGGSGTAWVQAVLHSTVGMNMHTACDTLCHQCRQEWRSQQQVGSGSLHWVLAVRALKASASIWAGSPEGCPCSSVLVTCGSDETMKLVNADSGKVIRLQIQNDRDGISHQLTGHCRPFRIKPSWTEMACCESWSSG